MSSLKKISAVSRAKLNLFLKVYGTRPDGFHEIQSIFQIIELEDTIKFSLERGRSGITIRTTHQELPIGDDNLIVKAYKKLAKIKEPPQGEGILCEVSKKIPIGAGLGGGSSNCAAALIALNSLLNTNLDFEMLSAIGAEIGSDVPFFFTGGTSLVYGKGEKVEILPDINQGGFIISVPPVKIDTTTAYKLLDSYRMKKGTGFSQAPQLSELRQLWSNGIISNDFVTYMHNDFEEAIFEQYPLIEDAKKRLEKVAGNVLMSGSGSAIFAYFPRYDDAWKALENYQPLPGEFLNISRPMKEGCEIHG